MAFIYHKHYKVYDQLFPKIQDGHLRNQPMYVIPYVVKKEHVHFQFIVTI